MNEMNTAGWVGRRLRVCGQVQGVGFRWTMAELANRLGVRGWVRNRRDGSVEALLYGPNPDVAALIHWAGQGPAGARVDAVEVEEVAEAWHELGVVFAQVPTV